MHRAIPPTLFNKASLWVISPLDVDRISIDCFSVLFTICSDLYVKVWIWLGVEISRMVLKKVVFL